MNALLSWACAAALASSASADETIAPIHQGSVSQTESVVGTNLNGTAVENAKLDAVDGKAEDSKPLQGKVTRKDSPGFGLFGRRWTTEDYRSLNYGVLGIVMVRWPFTKTERVTQVFPDCPAALAGIKPGDVVLQIADHVLSGHETQKTTWHTADGVAGTHVEYTIRRHGEILKFDLIRMNIEDIQNKSIRQLYERMLRELGPPGSVEPKRLQEPGLE